MRFLGQLLSPFGSLRNICSLRWWFLLICLQKATAVGQRAPSNTDTRGISPEIIPVKYEVQPRYLEVQRKLYGVDSEPAAEYYDENLDQQKLNAEVIPDYHGISLENQQVSNNNGNRATSNGPTSEDRLEHDNIKTFLQLNTLSGEQQYKQNKAPIKYIVPKRPLSKGDENQNLYSEPHRSAQSKDTLFQGLGDHRYSNELIKQLIGPGKNKIGLENKNQLKNAFLTKFTSYNITKLRGDKNNESFLFEKKDNSSSDIRYLDSKNRPTNYSDIHSSSLKTILQPETQVHETNSHNKGKKFQEDAENNQRKIDRDRTIPSPTVPPESNSLIENKLAKDLNNNAVDFGHIFNGQYELKHDRPNTLSLGYTQPYGQNYKSASGVLDGELIEEKSDNLGVKHDFVGGQFIDLQGRKDKEYGIAQYVISTDNPISDFVAGQFIKHSSNEKSTPKYLEINKNPMDFVGTQNLDENDESCSKELIENDYNENNQMNGQSLHEQITTNDSESTDKINQTTPMPEVTTILDFESDGLATHSSSYISDTNDALVFDNALSNDSRPTINSQTKEEENKIIPKILPDKKQTNSEKEYSSVIQENDEGVLDSIPVLGVSQTKTEIDNIKPIHKDKGNTSMLNKDKENNNYLTYPKQKKIANPVLIPYRPRIPYEATNPINQRRPVSVLHIGNKMYVPRLPVNGNKWRRPFNAIPNNQDNVVFKTNDGDTEIVVTVSSYPPYDTVQQKLPISVTNNSSDESKMNNHDEHDEVSKTIRPSIDDKNKAPNSEYDEYEDDGLLGNSNSNKSHSILKMDPNSSHYFTELAGNYKAELATEPNNLSFEGTRGVSSASPAETLNIDDIVGDSSDMLPNHFIYQSATSTSWPNTNRNISFDKTLDEPNISSQNISDTPKTSEDVELYAGNPLNIISKNYGQPPADIHYSDNIDSTKKEAKNDSKTKSHLAELCIPLTNEKYVSLLDLLKGPFYFDKNGKKTALRLRGDHEKNCTLSSKQCKVFVDLENISNTLNPANSLELIKEDQHFFQKTQHEKRHILKEPSLEPQSPYPNRKEFSSDKNKTEQVEQNVEDKSNLEVQLPGNMKRSSLKPYLKIASDTDLLPNTHEEDQKSSQEHRYSLDAISAKSDLPTISSSNDNLYDLLNYNLGSIHHGQFDLGNNPNQEVTNPDTHKSRPARMIDLGRSNEGEKCGCGENQILKSPSPFPNYKEFVAKRHNILKNIVHTVGEWAVN